MPFFAVKDATGATIYIAASGSGTTGDPYVPTHTFTNALPAGSAVIGKVGIDQTTPGTTNAVAVSNFPATQPVSIAAPVAVTGTFWQASQPISAASLPLPTGASTAAKQPALGTAGTPSADVITVQGAALGTPLPTLEQSRAAAAADVHAPAVNTAAVVTYAASAGVSHVIGGIAWSYSAAPTGGNLKVEDVSGTTVFSIDITAAGPGFIPFARPKKSAAQNTALIVTLAAAGAAVTGKVSVLSHWTE